MRTRAAIALGFVAGVALSAIIWVVVLRPSDTPADRVARSSSASGVIDEAARRATAAPLPSRPLPTATVPTTPSYGPRVDEPPPIYRCQSGGRTSYSNEPCPGSAIVQGSAVEGFDTRPSERLARLVAAGRADVDPASDSTARAGAPTVTPAVSVECANMRRQIVDLDRFLRQPNAIPVLDDARQRRQDIRTSMARLHC
jgi:hypothetical protein